MKFAFSTLAQFIETQASFNEICETLTKIGFEVENIHDKSKELAYFTVAKIIDTKPHENSSKLQICFVETIDNPNPIQIVCGAKNARKGIKVAYAPIDSVIPSNQMVIKKAKIAGIESNGMLCSASELNLGTDSDGIIEIPDQYPIGAKISKIFNQDDVIIELNITPNRGDCLGVYNIANELVATNIATFKKFDFFPPKSSINFDFKITNNDIINCKYISFRAIKNLKNIRSPEWLQNKLKDIGINSISSIVDICNYSTHIFNQPLHAYDIEKISNEIIIKYCDNNQEFKSLNNSIINLNPNILTISDNKNTLTIAGIIGGLDSAVNENTTNILIESAHFNADLISKTGRNLNINTDSRYRFERHTDYKNCNIAMNFATNLIMEICKGDCSEIATISNIDKPKVIDFDFNKFEKITGFKINKDVAYKILESLNFIIISPNKIEVPSSRNDINITEDLIEEILRIHGYNNIIKHEFHDKSSPSITSNIDQNLLHQIRVLLSSNNYHESISWTFIDEKLINLFDNSYTELLLKNPISNEMNYLRPNLIIGLINSYLKNYNRNSQNLSLFEIGNCFDKNLKQHLNISGIRCGKNIAQNHLEQQRDFDFYDIKKDIYLILQSLNFKTENIILSTDNPNKYYHPHRFANFKIGKNIIGCAGELHPKITQFFDIKIRPYIFEFFIENIPQINKLLTKKPYFANDFPIVERDFAFIIDSNLAVQELIKFVHNIDKDLIKNVNIFDIYQGKNIENNKKSIAIKVLIQHPSQTLDASQIENITSKIINGCKEKFNAELRK